MSTLTAGVPSPSLPPLRVEQVPLWSLAFVSGDPDIDAREAKKNELMAKASHMDAMRRVKGIVELPLWKLGADYWTLVHRTEAKVYPVGVCGDCACKDMAQYVRPMRAQLKAVAARYPVNDKHHYMRDLFHGLSVEVRCPRSESIVAVARLYPSMQKAALTFHNQKRWEELVAESYRLTEEHED